MDMILEIFLSKLFILADELERIRGLGRSVFLRRNQFYEYEDGVIGDPIPRWNPLENEDEMPEYMESALEEERVRFAKLMASLDEIREKNSNTKDKEAKDDAEETKDDAEKTKDDAEKTEYDAEKTKDNAEKTKDDGNKKDCASGKPASQPQEQSTVCTEPRYNGRPLRYRRAPVKPKRYGTLGNVTFELSDSD